MDKAYSVEPVFEEVYESGLKKFLIEYPRRLVCDCCGISEPPALSWNDFALGVWPHSVVARGFAYDKNPDGYCYNPNPIYSVMVNHEEVFSSIKEEYTDAE